MRKFKLPGDEKKVFRETIKEPQKVLFDEKEMKLRSNENVKIENTIKTKEMDFEEENGKVPKKKLSKKKKLNKKRLIFHKMHFPSKK